MHLTFVVALCIPMVSVSHTFIPLDVGLFRYSW